MLFGTLFGFTTSAGALYQAHWIGLAVTGAGLLLTTAMLSWSAQNRRGYGPALLAATAAPLLLANPTVALLEDFGFMHRQLFALKEQVVILTAMGEVSLFVVSPCRICATAVMLRDEITLELFAMLQAVVWNASWDRKLSARYRRCVLSLAALQARSGSFRLDASSSVR